MRILYVCSDSGIPVLGRKGAAVHVRSLANALARSGHSVSVATPLLVKSPWDSPAALDARVLHVPLSEATIASVDAIRAYTTALDTAPGVASEFRRILYNRQLESKLIRHFAQAPPDVIYERAAVFGTAGAAVARTLGVPLVVELNAPLGLEQSTYRGSQLPALAGSAERHTLGAADLVLVVSATLREYVVAQGVARERVHVVPNAVDPELFRPGPGQSDVRSRWHIGQGPVLGFVGGLRPWHGVRALPQVLERLAARYPGIQLVVVGDGPLRAEMMQVLDRHRLSNRVVFTSAIAHEQVPDVIRLFDVALAPYDEAEHAFYFSPLKIFEYMGCGVAVVAAGLGQIVDVVRDGVTGLLYPPGDLDALCRACGDLLADRARRQRIGRAAADEVRGRYTWAHNAERVGALMQGLRTAREACA